MSLQTHSKATQRLNPNNLSLLALVVLRDVGHQRHPSRLEKVPYFPHFQAIETSKQPQGRLYRLFITANKESPRDPLRVGHQLQRNNSIVIQNLTYEVRQGKSQPSIKGQQINVTLFTICLV